MPAIRIPCLYSLALSEGAPLKFPIVPGSRSSSPGSRWPSTANGEPPGYRSRYKRVAPADQARTGAHHDFQWAPRARPVPGSRATRDRGSPYDLLTVRPDDGTLLIGIWEIGKRQKQVSPQANIVAVSRARFYVQASAARAGPKAADGKPYSDGNPARLPGRLLCRALERVFSTSLDAGLRPMRPRARYLISHIRTMAEHAVHLLGSFRE